MTKRRTLKEQKFSINDIPIVEINNEHELSEVDTTAFFKDKSKVALALLQALEKGDSEAYKEILDAYLRINRSKAAIEAKLSRSTVSQAFSRGNPTLKTLSKIVHEATRQRK